MYIISFGGVDFVISVISIILVAISFHEYKIYYLFRESLKCIFSRIVKSLCIAILAQYKNNSINQFNKNVKEH